MPTEYGIRGEEGDDWGWDLDQGKWYCEITGRILVAREVSEPRIVSIRA